MCWKGDDEALFRELHHELRNLEVRIDQTVAEMYGLPDDRTVRPLPRFQPASQTVEALNLDGPVQLPAEIAIDFDAKHVRRFKRRPRIWIFTDAAKTKFFAVRHEQATRDVVRWIARQVGESIPRDWDRFIDDGIAVNIAPLAPILLNRQLKKESPKHVNATWSQTYRALARRGRGHDHFNLAMIASVNCAVLASPPKSRVSVLPSPSTAS